MPDLPPLDMGQKFTVFLKEWNAVESVIAGFATRCQHVVAYHG